MEKKKAKKKAEANLVLKVKRWTVLWGNVVYPFIFVKLYFSCCIALELKDIEYSFSLLLLYGLCLTIYVAVLRPALAPQGKHTKVLLDLSAWEGKLLV